MSRQDGDTTRYRTSVDELETSLYDRLDKQYFDKKFDMLLSIAGESGTFGKEICELAEEN